MKDAAKEYISEQARDPRGVLPDIFKPGDPLAEPSDPGRSRFPEIKYKIRAREINYVRGILEEFYKLGGYPSIKGRKKSSARRVARAKLSPQDRSKFLTAEGWLQWALAHNAVVSGRQKLTKRILGILKSGKRRKFSWYYFNRIRAGKRRGGFKRTPKGEKHFSPLPPAPKRKADKPKTTGRSATGDPGTGYRHPDLKYILNYRPDPSLEKYGARRGGRNVYTSPGTPDQIGLLQTSANTISGREVLTVDGVWGLDSYKMIRKIIQRNASGGGINGRARRIRILMENADRFAAMGRGDYAEWLDSSEPDLPEEEADKRMRKRFVASRIAYFESTLRKSDLRYLPKTGWATKAKVEESRQRLADSRAQSQSRRRRGTRIPKGFMWMYRVTPAGGKYRTSAPTREEYERAKQYCSNRRGAGVCKQFSKIMKGVCDDPAQRTSFAGRCKDWEFWDRQTPKKKKSPAPSTPGREAPLVARAKKQKGQKVAVYMPEPGTSWSKAYWGARSRGYLKVQVPGKKYAIYTRLKGESSAAWKKKMCSINPNCYITPDAPLPVAKPSPPPKSKTKTTKASGTPPSARVAKAALPQNKKWDSFEPDEDW